MRIILTVSALIFLSACATKPAKKASDEKKNEPVKVTEKKEEVKEEAPKAASPAGFTGFTPGMSAQQAKEIMMKLGYNLPAMKKEAEKPKKTFKQPHCDKLLSRANIGGFPFHVTAVRAKQIIDSLSYTPSPTSRSGIVIEELLTDPPPFTAVGKPLKYDRKGEDIYSNYEIELKFNEYFKLENITKIHRVKSDDKVDILGYYLKQYPMLVFQDKEDGENIDYKTMKREKITNTNYHYDGNGYSFIHLNHIRHYKEGGKYVDVLRLNSHEGNFAAVEAYKRLFKFDPNMMANHNCGY